MFESFLIALSCPILYHKHVIAKMSVKLCWHVELKWPGLSSCLV